MSIAVTLLLAAKLTPGIVAMSVESPSAERVPVLRAALTQDDAPVRAAAARIVAATDTRELLEDVRAALAKETNPEAAREEIRAIGMSGGVKETDALLAASKRFDSKLDGVVWESIARGGGPEAIGAMLAAKNAGFISYAMWGHPELALATTSRILGQGDPATCPRSRSMTGWRPSG
jgi:HEAT repeat protein